MDWAAPMDWMCEPQMLERTGLTVKDHQRLTIENFLDLRHRAPELPFTPVLQGWDIKDYHRHVDDYAAAGIDLTAEPLVGVGTVCRRQHTSAVEAVLTSLARRDLQLHGFGVKTLGLKRYGYCLKSCDSLAWSYRARNAPPLPGCTHKSCSNCLRFATAWRARLLKPPPLPAQQMSLGLTG